MDLVREHAGIGAVGHQTQSPVRAIAPLERKAIVGGSTSRTPESMARSETVASLTFLSGTADQSSSLRPTAGRSSISVGGCLEVLAQ